MPRKLLHTRALAPWSRRRHWRPTPLSTSGAFDQIVNFGSLAAGSQALNLTVPGNYATGTCVPARFRLYASDPGSPAPTGLVVGGEVEDQVL